MSANLPPYSLCSTPADDGYFVMNGRIRAEINGFRVWVPLVQWIPNRMSRECRYDARFTDPRCPADCPRRNLPLSTTKGV